MQPFGNDQTQYAVAQKFQPLVIARLTHAAMGEGFMPKMSNFRSRAGQVRDKAGGFIRQGGGGTQNVPPIRLQRVAVNQVHGFIHDEPPSVENIMMVARPTRLA